MPTLDSLILDRSPGWLFTENATVDQIVGANDPPRWGMLGMVLIIITTALGNALVCLAVSCERRLQNMNNYFLMSLAFADLLVAMLVMPPALIFEIYGYFPFSASICIIWSTMDVYLCTASIWHMCIMSMDRFFSLRYPIRYGRNRTSKMVAVKITAAWLIPVAICVALPIKGFSDYSNIYVDFICAPRMKGFVLIGSLFAFYLPLVIMLVTYGLTISILRGNQKRLQSFSQDKLSARRLHSERQVDTLGGQVEQVTHGNMSRHHLLDGQSGYTITSVGFASIGVSPADSGDTGGHNNRYLVANYQLQNSSENVSINESPHKTSCTNEEFLNITKPAACTKDSCRKSSLFVPLWHGARYRDSSLSTSSSQPFIKSSKACESLVTTRANISAPRNIFRALLGRRSETTRQPSPLPAGPPSDRTESFRLVDLESFIDSTPSDYTDSEDLGVRHASPRTNRHGSPLTNRHGSPRANRHGSPRTGRHGSPSTNKHGSLCTAGRREVEKGRTNGREDINGRTSNRYLTSNTIVRRFDAVKKKVLASVRHGGAKGRNKSSRAGAISIPSTSDFDQLKVTAAKSLEKVSAVLETEGTCNCAVRRIIGNEFIDECSPKESKLKSSSPSYRDDLKVPVTHRSRSRSLYSDIPQARESWACSKCDSKKHDITRSVQENEGKVDGNIDRNFVAIDCRGEAGGSVEDEKRLSCRCTSKQTDEQHETELPAGDSKCYLTCNGRVFLNVNGQNGKLTPNSYVPLQCSNKSFTWNSTDGIKNSAVSPDHHSKTYDMPRIADSKLLKPLLKSLNPGMSRSRSAAGKPPPDIPLTNLGRRHDVTSQSVTRSDTRLDTSVCSSISSEIHASSQLAKSKSDQNVEFSSVTAISKSPVQLSVTSVTDVLCSSKPNHLYYNSHLQSSVSTKSISDFSSTVGYAEKNSNSSAIVNRADLLITDKSNINGISVLLNSVESREDVRDLLNVATATCTTSHQQQQQQQKQQQQKLQAVRAEKMGSSECDVRLHCTSSCPDMRLFCRADDCEFSTSSIKCSENLCNAALNGESLCNAALKGESCSIKNDQSQRSSANQSEVFCHNQLPANNCNYNESRKKYISPNHLNLVVSSRQFKPSQNVQSSRSRRQYRPAKRRGSNERKASKVLGIIFAVFVVVWLPFFITNMVSVFCDRCMQDMPGYMLSMFLWLGYVSSLANPIIYTMFSTSFRTVFIRLVTCQYAICKRRASSNNCLSYYKK